MYESFWILYINNENIIVSILYSTMYISTQTKIETKYTQLRTIQKSYTLRLMFMCNQNKCDTILWNQDVWFLLRILVTTLIQCNWANAKANILKIKANQIHVSSSNMDY